MPWEKIKTEPMVKATSHKKKSTYLLTHIMAKPKKKMKIKGKKQIFTFKTQPRL